jgi:hypothetical protein
MLTKLITSALNGLCNLVAGKFVKLGHCQIQIRPQGVKTGQYPGRAGTWPAPKKRPQRHGESLRPPTAGWNIRGHGMPATWNRYARARFVVPLLLRVLAARRVIDPA